MEFRLAQDACLSKRTVVVSLPVPVPIVARLRGRGLRRNIRIDGPTLITAASPPIRGHSDDDVTLCPAQTGGVPLHGAMTIILAVCPKAPVS